MNDPLSIAAALLALLGSPAFAGGAPSVPALVDPADVAFDPEGRLVVSKRGAVLVLARSGELIREVGRGGLSRPQGVAVDGAGRIYVSDPEAGGVFLFGPEGDLLARTAEVASPGDIALGPDGTVFACDPAGGRLVAFAPDLGAVRFVVARVSADPGPRALGEPRGVACSGGRIAVADARGGRVLVGPIPAAEDPILRAWLLVAPFGFEPRAVAFGRDGRVFVVDRGAVRAFSADGRDLGAFRARAVRAWYEPRGMATDGSGLLFSVDGSTRRVLGTTEDLFDEEPRIEIDPRDPALAVVEWKSLSPRPSVVRWGPTEACEREARHDEPKTAHRIVLRGLEPSTRYYLHVADPLEAVPPTTPPRPDLLLKTQRTSYALLSAGNFSGEYPFATGPGEGRAEWASLPAIVLVYLRVSFPPGPDGSKPPDRVLAEADLEVLRSELETYRVWVWRHSHLKLNLDFSWVIVGEARESSELGEVTPTVLRDIERGLAAQGKRVDDFWNAIVVGTHGWYAHYLAGTVAGSDHELGSCYVGFGPGTRPGWWWFPTHEHGHLIHSMVMCSNAGHFAFPDAPWTLPGKFGENFSFLAYNYRQFPPRGWLLLKTSALRSSPDRNGNGVPDDDPAVPLDERRFGRTEALGGDAFRRILAGVRTPGYPGSEDVDFEGRRHRLNEGELYWTDRKVRRSTPVLDGRISEGEWTEIAFLPNVSTPADRRGVRARLFVAWDEGRYYVAVRASQRVCATFDLDAANDGWFHGRDNLRFSVRPEGVPAGARAEGAIWDFLHDTLHVHEGQHWWREAYAPGDIAAAAGEEGGWWVLECAVPARREIGIRPRLGGKFALNAQISSDPPGDLPPTPFLDGEDFLYDLSCEPEGERAGWIPLWDGEVVAAADPGRAPAWFLPERPARFRDFDFRGEAWTEPGAAAGILFHTDAARGAPPEKGYEVRIHNSCRPEGGGEPCDPRATGSLVRTRSVYASAASDREWFPLEISVRGRRVLVRVNGLAVVDYAEPPEPRRAGPGRVLGEGTFAIAARGGEVRFRALAARAAEASLGEPPPANPRLDELEERGYPIWNAHVHLKGGLTLEEAFRESVRTGIPYGVAVNCGLNFPVRTDAALLETLCRLRGRPVFAAVQAEGREWTGLVSPRVVSEFDYVFSDSMTFSDDEGRRMRLWIPGEVRIGDPEAFLDLLVARTVRMIEEEPIDVYANPTFLPDRLRSRYEELWTDERIDRVIRAAVARGVAIEINAPLRLPSARFLRRAKALGAKFTLGTNNAGREVGSLDWAFDRIAECGIEPGDLWLPRPDRPGREPWLALVAGALDRLLEYGTDRYGPVSTGMFLAILDPVARSSPEEPLFLDTGAYFEEGRAHRRAIRGSNFWYDQAAIRVLYRVSELTGDRRYAEAADRSIDDFFRHAIRETGLPAWGTHVYYDAFLDRPGGDADGRGPHEILVYHPEWGALCRRDPEGARRIVDRIWERHVCDPATGQHNRHDDGRPGCDFAFSGGSFALACAALYAETKEARYLDRARTIADWHWRHRDPRTGLIPDAPSLKDRFDGQHSMTTIPGPFASQLLRAYELARDRWFLDVAVACVKAWDRWAWDEARGTYWSMLRLDGTPVEEGPRGEGYDVWAPRGPVDIWKTTIYSYEFPLVAAQSAIYAYELTAGPGGKGDPELLAIALRWARAIEKELPPKPGRRFGAELALAMPEVEKTGGTYAEDYARAISFFLHLHHATGEARHRKLALELAREAVEKLFREGLPRAHPAKPYWEATQGSGLLLHALLELAVFPERWRGAF